MDSLVLFLNPGLHLSRVSSGKVTLPYWRDEQVCVINCRLESKDSLVVDMDYAGVLDDRICDLFLNRKDYEDSFCGDHFFPTGRRGAFVDKLSKNIPLKKFAVLSVGLDAIPVSASRVYSATNSVL